MQSALAKLALSRVKPDATGYAKLIQGVDDCHSALDCTSGAIKRCQETIARCVELLAAMTCKLAAHRCMMGLQQISEAQISLLDSYLRGADDICEHQSRYTTLENFRRRATCQESLDVVHKLFCSFEEWQMIGGVDFDILGARDSAMYRPAPTGTARSLLA